MQKRLLIFFLFFLAIAPATYAQDEDGYKKEFDYGINFNTNGGLIGGAMIKSSRYMENNWQRFWGIELVEVKHAKEARTASQYTGDVFIIGKQNYLFVIRPHIGREYAFFRKASESGVQINGIVAAGPSLGLLAPYYIYYNHGTISNNGIFSEDDIRLEAYDPAIHREDNRIMGNASFATGLGESKLNLGAHLKTGVSFEYGRYHENITGVETGFLFEAYPNKLVILPRTTNHSTFASFYFTVYYGRRK